MSLKDWSTTPASNNAAAPNGWPESTMLVNQINDTGRQMMADVRAWYEDAQWIDYGHTPTRVSATVFSVPGTHSGTYSVNRRVRVADAATYLGSISDVTAAGGITSVTLALDTGSLTGSISAVSVAAVTGDSLPAALLDSADIGVTVQGYDADTAIKDTASYFSNAFGLSGVISPAQLTGDQNDWTPTGLSGATYIRVDTDASRTVTGLTGGVEGRLITIVNVGSNDLVLAHQSSSSTAANRFLFAAAEDLTLEGGQSVTLRYDDTTDRWRRLEETASAATGGRVLLATGTASNSATIDFTTGFDTAYRVYEIDMIDVTVQTDDVALRMRVSNDGGSSYLSTNIYSWAMRVLGGSGTTATEPTAGGGLDSSISLTDTASTNKIGNASTESLAGRVELFGFSDTGANSRPQVLWQTHWRRPDGAPRVAIGGGGEIAQGSGLNGIRLYADSGNIVSGTFKLYGVL